VNPHWDDLAVALGFERLQDDPKRTRTPRPSC
jgi:hypothetical protein